MTGYAKILCSGRIVEVWIEDGTFVVFYGQNHHGFCSFHGPYSLDDPRFQILD